ncbi:MAG: hypothetical protein ABS942_15735 [Solibacillus sp.]|uniref:hypothetical protein n=1 Tax=Solibacillus sp. FSL H8-0523 TaxID=2954511 RepID=UPI0031012E19
MTLDEISVVKHALKNGNRFYTESDDPIWNGLVNKGYAVKRGGWEDGMSYFIVTDEGKEAFEQSQASMK